MARYSLNEKASYNGDPVARAKINKFSSQAPLAKRPKINDYVSIIRIANGKKRTLLPIYYCVTIKSFSLKGSVVYVLFYANTLSQR